MNDGLGKAGTVAVTFGKRIHTLVQDRFEEAQVDDAMNGSFAIPPTNTADFSCEIKETMDGHIRVARGTLRQIAHQTLGMDWLINDVVIPYPDLTLGWGDKTGDHAHGG